MKQAPSWNSVVAEFGKNPDVAFGDVALSKNQVRTIHGENQNPGAGGWPTVRYFNKETGYGGKPYPKKTSKAMCDELGPKESYMKEWIEEFATLCDANATDKTGCSEQQIKFIDKWSGKPKEDLKGQLTRLKGMVDKDGASMKPDALKWEWSLVAALPANHSSRSCPCQPKLFHMKQSDCQKL